MLSDALGSLFFVTLFLVRVEQGTQGSLTAWFLAAQSAVVTVRIIFRQPAAKSSPWPIQMIAWLSAIAPLAMIVTGITWFPIPGLALSLWSLFALGDAFSISPADRGLVRRGPYRLLRHPMYAGELLSLLGLCLASSSIWNWTILAVFGVSIYRRIVEEETLLNGYYRYMRETKWRLLPGIW